MFQTGLAMADTARFPGTYQAHVQGNIVNGQYIAGIVFIIQDPVNQIEGFIEKFDYANGIMYINGNRIQINDPKLTITVSRSVRTADTRCQWESDGTDQRQIQRRPVAGSSLRGRPEQHHCTFTDGLSDVHSERQPIH